MANQCKLYAPPAGPGKDVDSIVAELKQFADERKIPKGEMIIGYGYDDTVMPDGRLLNRDDLDAAFPDNPVRVDHVSMHGTVLNSLALKKYGYQRRHEDAPGRRHRAQAGHERALRPDHGDRVPPGGGEVGADDAGAGDRVDEGGPDALRGSRRHHRPRRGDATWRSCRR